MKKIKENELHSFNTDVAKQYGVDIAVLFHLLVFWILNNAKSNVNYREGKYWTFMSAKDIHNRLNYFSERKIYHLLNKLIGFNLIISSNFNANPYNRKKWYTLGEKGVQVLKETYHIDFLNLENGIDGKCNSTYYKREKCKKDIINNLNNKDINKSINVETPTLNDVEQYVRQESLGINPSLFFYHYQSNNWLNIKDWQAKAREWSIRENKMRKQDEKKEIEYDLSKCDY